MAEPKTKLTTASVAKFLNALPDEQKRQDSWAIVEMMRAATKAEPKLWGSNIVGFGAYQYGYADGKERDWPLVAFSPRTPNITLYLSPDFEQYDELLTKLGKHSCGKVCLYIKRLSDVHVPTLKKLINASVKHMLKTNKPMKRQSARAAQ